MAGACRALLVATLALTAATACAHSGRPIGTAGDEEGAHAARESATLEVANHNWNDMTVYAVRGGMRYRLGIVVSMGKKLFEIPIHAIVGRNGLRLEADPIGPRDTYLSPPIMVGFGERVRWELENNLSLSTYSVR